MIVKRATLDDLNQLAVLFDEYRQFYGASSNLNLSGASLITIAPFFFAHYTSTLFICP